MNHRTGLTALLAALLLAGCPGEPTPEPVLPADDDAGDDDSAADDDDSGQPDDDDLADDDDSGQPDDDDSGPLPDDDDATVDPSPSFEECFSKFTPDPSEPGPDYDQFSPTLGQHCNGTNHQAIAGVERVVFIGDSVTVGSPPSYDWEYYRNLLADSLATEFGIDAPGYLWQTVDPFNGVVWQQESGDFACCAEWGARADDLMQDGDQVLDCLPESERDKTTLVVMTVGGNDLSNLTEGFMNGEPVADLWAETWEFMGLVRETVEWITAPGRFLNGVYVVTTNLYEFTDATGDVTSCPAAGLAGFGEAVTDPALAEMVIWAMEEFMSIAVDTGTDMLFLLETFCGHGFNYDDPDGRCYRGPDAELWFDLTCIHPNPIGHAVIADMFFNVVQE